MVKTKAKEKEKKSVKAEKLSIADYEEKVKSLAKEGFTAEKIGQKLKESGIHPKEYSKKISKILGEDYVNPDLKNVEEKLKNIEIHFNKNKQDKRAKREKDRVFSQLRRLKIYFGLN